MRNNDEKFTEYNILNLIQLILKWRRAIIIMIAISLAIGVGLSFIVKREYKSVTQILPPKETNLLSGISGLSSLAKSLPASLGKLGKVEDPFDYIAILRSRTVLESIVNKFDLFGVYGISNNSKEKATKILKNNTEIDWTEENTLEIRVWDESAQRASNIANSYVEILNQRSYELKTQEARDTRNFIERRVQQNREDLYKAEKDLQEYQEKYGMIMTIDPSFSGASSIAEFYALKVKKEIEYEILKKTVGVNNLQCEQVLSEIQILNTKINKFPEIGMSSLRLYREVAIQQKILEFITPLLEQAKVNEHKEVPVAYILDPAIPGERPDRPKRLFIVGITVFLGIIFSLIYISYKEYTFNLKMTSPKEWEQLQATLKSFKLFKKGHGSHT